MIDSDLIRTLTDLGAIKPERLVLFHPRTRDDPAVEVYVDSDTGVIVLDRPFVGEDTYHGGTTDPVTGSQVSSMHATDTARRLSRYGHLARARNVVDFGCGDGAFLDGVAKLAIRACGVELNESSIAKLRERGHEAVGSISEVTFRSETTYLFHVLEHLPSPLDSLVQIRANLKDDGGMVVVEVPSANDLLIHLGPESFKDFTFWSQHLVLHTRDSLRRLLQAAGFRVLAIEGVQRYPLSNHLLWLAGGRPGGHDTWLSALDGPDLIEAYGHALARIDATDTLVAIAEVDRSSWS